MASTPINAFDLSLLHLLYCGAAPRAVRTLVAAISFLGSGWMLLPLAGGLFSRVLRLRCVWLIGSILATSALVSQLKAWIARIRPCNALAWVTCAYGQAPVDPSWPSGHAAGVFVLAGFVWVFDRRWGAVSAAVAAMVAMSRVSLGVHYPTDVICAACLGAVIGYGAAKAARYRASTRR
jgi:membrane-associated phospholipid phosphatase